MSIFEYDEEKHLKNEREYAYNQGRKTGEQQGKTEGIRILIKGYMEEGISKERTLQLLEKFYSLSKEEAEAYYTEIESSTVQS